MKNKKQADLPDGRRYVRSTDRDYQYTVVVDMANGRTLVSWHGNLELAQRRAANWLSVPRWAQGDYRAQLQATIAAATVQVVPCYTVRKVQA